MDEQKKEATSHQELEERLYNISNKSSNILTPETVYEKIKEAMDSIKKLETVRMKNLEDQLTKKIDEV